MTRDDSDAVTAWLDRFSACVRAGDLDAGRDLFAAEASGFGTVAPAYSGLDDLVAAQWSEVWARTEDFTFDDVVEQWRDGGLCVVAATWTSFGTEAGARRSRAGRATLVLRLRGARWEAVHSHFSMVPGTAA